MTWPPIYGASGSVMDRPKQAVVGGVSFRMTSVEALRRAISRHRNDPTEPLVIGYVNPHVVTCAEQHGSIARHLATCDHVCVDGFGVALVLRLRGVTVERLPAHRAADLLIDRAVLAGRTLLIGIGAEHIARAASALEARAEGITVVGRLSGYASEAEIEGLLDRNTDADVVLIGAGSPRSEDIAEQVRSSTDHAVVFHVGAGTLKVWAGLRRHPPRCLAAVGMGWTYRFWREPHTRSRYIIGAGRYLTAVTRSSRRVIEPYEQGVNICES